ncbi:hypothetical protein GGR50DRAFT_166047 [Xylaria sp. CBS 124048]|nr:hypothetical protein GGR50DRAFT_166047 [Xylaria sp. CBS 124048]
MYFIKSSFLILQSILPSHRALGTHSSSDIIQEAAHLYSLHIPEEKITDCRQTNQIPTQVRALKPCEGLASGPYCRTLSGPGRMFLLPACLHRVSFNTDIRYYGPPGSRGGRAGDHHLFPAHFREAGDSSGFLIRQWRSQHTCSLLSETKAACLRPVQICTTPMLIGIAQNNVYVICISTRAPRHVNAYLG